MPHTDVSTASPSVRPPPPAPEPDSGALRVRELIAENGAKPSDPTPKEPAPKPRRGLSILQKLLLLILSLLLGVVALLAGYLLSAQVSEMREALESKASTYGRLVSKQVESAIAFDDRETAREVFDSVAQDSDVESLTLFTSKGAVLRAFGSISSAAAAQAANVTERTLVAQGDRISVFAPVVSLEGPRGTLVVELSTRRLDASLVAAQRRAGLAFLLAAVFGAVGAFTIARSLARRLRAIAGAADAVAAGNLNQKPVSDPGRGDEISVMVTAFNAMLKQLRGLVEHIKLAAREEQARLEQLVLARTAELDARNDDMRRVLDNVGQGFLTLGLDGKMSRERSRILETWFGSAPASGSFVDYLAAVDAEAGHWFKVGFDAVAEDLLPVEVTLDQLPKRLALAGKYFELEYRPVLNAEGKLERVLLVLSDVTAVLERERAEAGEREATRLFTRIVADRAGFLEFFAEAQALVAEVSADTPNPEALTRPLHTLKGNAAIYGVDSVARLCHELETTLGEAGTLTKQDLAPLVERWSELAAKVRTLLGDASGKLEISEGDYQELLRVVDGQAPHAEIRRLVQAFRLEPTETRLQRVAEHAQALAFRLGKGPIEVEIESNQLRLRPEQWAEFWSAAVHVIRNSIDHGLEGAEERLALGKTEVGRIGFRTRLADKRFTIEFSDDGRGVDWARVSEKAKSRGLPSTKQSELVDALFAEGISTREQATETSGRGVGLSAVRAACKKLGGNVEVESQPGKGSIFRFVWPSELVFAPARSAQSPASLAR